MCTSIITTMVILSICTIVVTPGVVNGVRIIGVVTGMRRAWSPVATTW